MSDHVQGVVRKCAQSLHVIRVLRRHGMNDQALQAIYRSVVLAKLLYTSSAWWGFTTADDRHRIEAVGLYYYSFEHTYCIPNQSELQLIRPHVYLAILARQCSTDWWALTREV